MSRDFFLQNRSHQLARLCSSSDSAWQTALESSKTKRSTELASLVELIDRICQSDRDDDGAGLTSQQRRDLDEFERSIVRLRFSRDDHTKGPAVTLIKAIFADAEYFSGLKPLPQYTDSFAYELLFPSWLNLLSACMLPRAEDGKPRLEGSRQGTLFEFLGKLNSVQDSCEDDLIGLLTLIASRFDAPVCEELLHRTVELFGEENCSLIDRVNSLQDACRNAKDFAGRLRDYLTVKHSMSKWPARSAYPISYRRPLIRVLPTGTTQVLESLESQGDWDKYSQIAAPLRELINSDHLLETNLIQAFEKHPEQLAGLYNLVIRPGNEPTFLPSEGQLALAGAIDGEASQGEDLNLERLAAFTTAVAPRLGGLNQATLGFFIRQFIADASNRTMMFDACRSDAMRQKLSEFVVQQASQSSSPERFLDLLTCAAIVSPQENAPAAQASIQAIDAVVQNRSIGNREYQDLIGDLQANADDAIEYLATPILAISGKSSRLAALYMTLNEVSETYSATGKADNFSVVRAKYVAITKLHEDE